MLRCPACEIPLCGMTYEGVTIQRCPDCGGCLVEDQRLRIIQDRRDRTWAAEDEGRLAAEVAASDRLGPVRCPRCLMPMKKTLAGKGEDVFHLDHCGPCGAVWLDRGELELLQVRWEKERDGRTEADWDRIERRASAEMGLRSEAGEIADTDEWLKPDHLERGYLGSVMAPGGLGHFRALLWLLRAILTR